MTRLYVDIYICYSMIVHALGGLTAHQHEPPTPSSHRSTAGRSPAARPNEISAGVDEDIDAIRHLSKPS